MTPRLHHFPAFIVYYIASVVMPGQSNGVLKVVVIKVCSCVPCLSYLQSFGLRFPASGCYLSSFIQNYETTLLTAAMLTPDPARPKTAEGV